MGTFYAPRTGKAADWTAANPVLASREPGLETDTGQLKYGDGTSTWLALSYVGKGSEQPTSIVPGTMRGEWLDGEEYFEGDIVIYSGLTYYAAVQHVSGLTFTSSNWTLLPVAATGSAVTYTATVDTSLTSQTALTTDANFPTIPVAANSTYQLDLTLMWNLATGGSTTTDCKVGFSAPSGVSGYWGSNAVGWQQPIATGTVSGPLTAFPSAVQMSLSEGVYGTTLRAIATTSTTAGNLAFQFAQVTSSTFALTRVAGSNILVRKLV